jgi:hypothetical protein
MEQICNVFQISKYEQISNQDKSLNWKYWETKQIFKMEWKKSRTNLTKIQKKEQKELEWI